MCHPLDWRSAAHQPAAGPARQGLEAHRTLRYGHRMGEKVAGGKAAADAGLTRYMIIGIVVGMIAGPVLGMLVPTIGVGFGISIGLMLGILGAVIAWLVVRPKK